MDCVVRSSDRMDGLTPVKSILETRTRPGTGVSAVPEDVVDGAAGVGPWARPGVTAKRIAAPARSTGTKRGCGMGTRRSHMRRPAIIAIADWIVPLSTPSALGGRGARLAVAHETTAAAAADHAALATGRSCLFGGPLVGRTLGVRCAPTLAGNLALLLRRHGREAAALFPTNGLIAFSGASRIGRAHLVVHLEPPR